MGILKKYNSNILVALILLLASFLRLYRISDYMTFLGDEGRDVLVVRGILHGDFVFLGPRSSAADFFYGPIYYYFITPFLWLSQYDPVGPATFVALIGIATVFLVYLVGKQFLGEKAGLFAAALYAVSPVVINYSHSSWNPNPMPFVSLLLLYLLYRAVQGNSLKMYFAVGVLFGIAMQLQYIAMFLAAVIGIYIFFGNYFIKLQKNLFAILKAYIFVALGFISGLSLFFAFEIKNNFPNIRTIINYIFLSEGQEEQQTVEYFQNIPEVFFRLFSRFITRFPPADQLDSVDPSTLLFWQIATFILAVLSVLFLVKAKNKLHMSLLLFWFLFGVGLFGFYRKPIYDYYLGFLFPLPFLLVGNMLSLSFDSKVLRKITLPISILLFLSLFLFNLLGMPFRYTANKQKDQIKTISEFVLSKTDGKPFNFALITPGNSDHGYRYYFEILGSEAAVMDNVINDPERKTVTDQLLVVCEDPACSPLGHSLFEVAGFGRAEIVGEWNISVVKVYKLVRYSQEE